MKNKVKLNEKHIDYLSSLPEQGMGYQVIEIILKDGRKLSQRTVLNSTYLVLNDNEAVDPDLIEEVSLSK